MNCLCLNRKLNQPAVRRQYEEKIRNNLPKVSFYPIPRKNYSKPKVSPSFDYCTTSFKSPVNVLCQRIKQERHRHLHLHLSLDLFLSPPVFPTNFLQIGIVPPPRDYCTTIDFVVVCPSLSLLVGTVSALKKAR